ncbi:hypothetical protein [Mycobacterium lepromatosis]|uniref:hypothetical protein n=1 Tax=Mycobacterium lepromatosis TaxID=480418 RepID=UPI0012E088BE|nr:hypothetical protein [Mycobacterium lepromatosis]
MPRYLVVLVEFDLTGPLARRIRVSVDGCAQLIDDFVKLQPMAVVQLDGLQFTRLADGSARCAPRAKRRH